MAGRLRHILSFAPLLCFWALVCACSPVVNLNADLKEYTIHLYLKEYTPQVNVSIPEYKCKKMCLANIRNDARNTTNFSYYSKDNRVQYLLSNRANTHVQLIPSFFWYAYQKAFESVGIETLARCNADIPEVWIIFLSLDEDHVTFKLTLFENREAIFEKEMTVGIPPATDRTPASLQKRGYDLINLTIQTILNDPGFKAAFF